MTDEKIRMRDVLKAHRLGIQPSGGVCSCGEWTERPYGSVLWGPDDWEEHLEEALEAAGALHVSEVKVLTETATRVAYALGRKDAAEEIAAELRRRSDIGTRGQIRAYADALAGRYATSQGPQAASDATSGVPGHQEVGSGGQAASNRLPRRCPECGELHVMGCPDCGADLDMRGHYPNCPQEVSEAVRSPQEPGEGS